ncbi:S-formylglutathione hydrolase, partial [Rhizobium ruizarguesonis]
MDRTSKTTSTENPHGGTQGGYVNRSEVCDCDMTCAVFLPPQAKGRKRPGLWDLAGLTCTHA